MEQNKQTTHNLVITRDGEVTNEFQPSAANQALSAVFNGLDHVMQHIKLETRMIAYDALHNTNYRAIRHDLVAQQKRERFEASIGLIAVSK